MMPQGEPAVPKRLLWMSAIGLALIGIAAWQLPVHLRAPPPTARAPVAIVADVTGEPITPLPESIPLDARKVALGNRLFHDKRLSRDNSVACANCHVLDKGGVDGRQRSIGIGGQTVAVNAPTVFNSGFNFKQFWDGRAESLEDQIDGPVHNAGEMGSSWPEVIGKLKNDAAYVPAFANIYPDGIQEKNIKDAIATFERALVTPNSRFDKTLRGDRNTMTADELKGYRLFKNYGCIACHQGVNIGGNMFERLGVMGDYFKDRGNIVQADLGRFNVTKNEEDKHMFKVPSLRNVALTAPYFHDGSAATLEQAVIIMGKYQLGVVIPASDVALITAFLKTLTGEYAGKPQ